MASTRLLDEFPTWLGHLLSTHIRNYVITNHHYLVRNQGYLVFRIFPCFFTFSAPNTRADNLAWKNGKSNHKSYPQENSSTAFFSEANSRAAVVEFLHGISQKNTIWVFSFHTMESSIGSALLFRGVIHLLISTFWSHLAAAPCSLLLASLSCQSRSQSWHLSAPCT